MTPTPMPTPESFWDSGTFEVLFEVFKLLLAALFGGAIAYLFGRRERREHARNDRASRDYQAHLDREAREEQREQEELRDWQELIGDLRTVLRSDFAQYDDSARIQRAREEWDRRLERRLTGLAAFSSNVPAHKIAHRLRVEFHRLRETTFFFQSRDHTDRRWDEQYQRFDVAWNEALFLIGKLIEALGGEKAPSRKEWPGSLRHEDDDRDRNELG
jgi:hypothetical protein